jgi:hypothetical protein
MKACCVACTHADVMANKLIASSVVVVHQNEHKRSDKACYAACSMKHMLCVT